MQRVVIIGGGAIGSAAAYWLTADPGFVGEVIVVERDPTYREASSALSASSIRQQFSTAVNIEIGKFGIGFLRDVGRTLAVGDEHPDIGLTEPGYLFLATAAGVSHAARQPSPSVPAWRGRDAPRPRRAAAALSLAERGRCRRRLARADRRRLVRRLCAAARLSRESDRPGCALPQGRGGRDDDSRWPGHLGAAGRWVRARL